jgi:hypothetical protein
LNVSIFEPANKLQYFFCKMIQTFQNIFSELTLFDLVLLAIFIVLFFLRLIYLFLFTGRVLFKKRLNFDQSKHSPFSLILTLRNQEDNLKNNLPNILSNEAVDFEVVVVDDYSQDNSFLVLGLLNKKYKRLKISMLNQETRFSTKLAQNIALKAAKYDWVLTTPVEMYKVNPEWLSIISKVLTHEKSVVVAYSNVENSRGFFNHLFRIENCFQYQRSIGFILNGISYVYSEENVAFQKSNYFEMDGYRQKITEPFANLELLINSFIRKKTTTILFNKETSIRKKEPINHADYFELLKKSIRIEKHLSYPKRIVLASEETVRLLILPFAIVVIVLYTELWPVVAGLLGTKFLIHLVIIKILQNRLNERKIFISSLVYDLIMPYFKLFYRWHFNRRSRKNRWRNKS